MYLSYFSNYNPATWMKDQLLPTKGDYTPAGYCPAGSA